MKAIVLEHCVLCALAQIDRRASAALEVRCALPMRWPMTYSRCPRTAGSSTLPMSKILARARRAEQRDLVRALVPSFPTTFIPSCRGWSFCAIAKYSNAGSTSAAMACAKAICFTMCLRRILHVR